VKWYRVYVEPLGGLFFRKPGVYTAGASGPAAAGASYSYPLPSTVAGQLAALLRRAGVNPQGRGSGRFGDLDAVFRAACGGEYRLRTGLVEYAGRVYAYLNRSEFAPLDKLKRLGEILKEIGGVEADGPVAHSLDCAIKERVLKDEEGGRAFKVSRVEQVKVGLDRKRKTAAEQLLYTRDEVHYPQGARLLHLLRCGGEPQVGGVAKLGGDMGMTHVKVGGEANPELLLGGDAGHENWLVILVSPALLDAEENRMPGQVGKPVDVSHEKYAEKLADKLLRPAFKGEEKWGSARAVLAPKGEARLEVIFPGWESKWNSSGISAGSGAYRRPALLVPAGTVLYVEGLGSGAARRLVENGVGVDSRLGWGTVVLSPLPS